MGLGGTEVRHREAIQDLLDGGSRVLDEDYLITIKDKGLPFSIVLAAVRGTAIVTIGCHTMSLAGWLRSYQRIGETNRWNEKQILVAGAYLNHLRDVAVLRGLSLRATKQGNLLDVCYEVLPFLQGAEHEKLLRAMAGAGGDEKAEEPLANQRAYPWWRNASGSRTGE